MKVTRSAATPITLGQGPPETEEPSVPDDDTADLDDDQADSGPDRDHKGLGD